VYRGWPGSAHDARVFVHSSLGTSNRLLPDARKTIEGTEVPLYIVGYSAYSLLKWLMKSFQHTVLLTSNIACGS